LNWGYLFNVYLEDTKVRLQIADEGGIGAVVSAMQNHPKEAAVQEEGIAALWSLARSCGM
jgi:hypothetical protein